MRRHTTIPLVPGLDGRRIFMVCTELLMTLFALLYAFPHVPSALLHDVPVPGETDEAAGTDDADAPWFSVTSTAALRSAMEAILKTSQTLEVSLFQDATLNDITKESVADPERLSRLFDLRLYEAGVPATTRQMVESLCAAYRALLDATVTTREELWALYRRYQLIPAGYQLPGMARVEKEDRSALIRFCSELTVAWMQPYFAQNAKFYLPDEVAATGCKAGRARAGARPIPTPA